MNILRLSVATFPAVFSDFDCGKVMLEPDRRQCRLTLHTQQKLFKTFTRNIISINISIFGSFFRLVKERILNSLMTDCSQPYV